MVYKGQQVVISKRYGFIILRDTSGVKLCHGKTLEEALSKL